MKFKLPVGGADAVVKEVAKPAQPSDKKRLLSEVRQVTFGNDYRTTSSRGIERLAPDGYLR